MTPAVRSRAIDWIWWLAPVAILFLVFQDGLRCWFSADDFAWLGLLRQVDSPHDILPILFAPAAQGTIRPWSERGFFLLFESLFGLDSLPFRIMDFLTMAANLLLVAWITRRITHSKLAGAIAAAAWASNAALMVVMTWSSAYNQALCSLFLLSALALFIRYTETGERKFWWSQLVVFSLGFGALEMNVVYPALAAAYVLFVAPYTARRRLLAGLAPLFAISVAYFLIHRAVAPLPKTGEYVLHFDARILRTFILYCKWSLLPVVWEAWGHSRRLGRLIILIELLGLAALFVAEFRQRRPTALFFVAWYLIALAPVLPLPDHHTEYYVTIPLIGLAMLAAWGVTCASRAAGNWRYAAVLPVVCWIAANIPVARSSTRWSLDRSREIRAVVLGVEAAHEAHPDKTILLDGIPQGVYEDSIAQGAFYPLSLDNVYLTAKSGLTLKPPPDTADLDRAVLDPAAEIHAIQNDQVVVYSTAGDHLRNITERYERSAPNRLSDRLPTRVDVGNPLYSWLLGPTWLAPLSGVRWMPGEATVRLAGPVSPGNKLVLDGYCPREQLKQAPRHLLVSVDGLRIGEAQINDPESDFERLFVLPDALVGRPSVEVAIHVDPVERKGGQDYGLVFGKIAIRP